ncbi:MAG: response regulator transcription factor [Ignavibacteriae bacterium]|nr:response regulator transcription factor [Ignavibacteriota bacterium]
MDELTEKFTDGTLTIWIVDDQRDVHTSIKNTIEDANWNVSLQSFSSCEDAIKHLQQGVVPDIILQDISIPGKMSGIHALEIYKQKIPDTKIIMFTIHEDDFNVLESIRRGAKGYFAKSSPNVRVIQTIKDALEGLVPIDPHVAGNILKYLSMSTDVHREFQLTDRETEILQMLITKKTRTMIADELFISNNTLKKHIQHIYDKLQVHNRAEAIVVALKMKK